MAQNWHPAQMTNMGIAIPVISSTGANLVMLLQNPGVTQAPFVFPNGSNGIQPYASYGCGELQHPRDPVNVLIQNPVEPRPRPLAPVNLNLNSRPIQNAYVPPQNAYVPPPLSLKQENALGCDENFSSDNKENICESDEMIYSADSSYANGSAQLQKSENCTQLIKVEPLTTSELMRKNHLMEPVDDTGSQNGGSAKCEEVRVLTPRKTKLYTCETCGIGFSQPSGLTRHMRIHRREKPFHCEVCERSFRRQDTLKEHIKVHIGATSEIPETCVEADEDENRSEHSCDVCGKRFQFEQDLNSHIETHNEVQDGCYVYSCNRCGKEFLAQQSLTYHMKIHKKGLLHVCDQCGKRFRSMDQLETHVEMQHTKKPCKCNVCGKIYSNENALRRHLKTHDVERLTCDICGKTYSNESGFRRHLRLHNGESFTCDICRKMFVEKRRLQIHMRVHSGEQPFICEVCGKRFSQGSNLQIHLRIHTGERPFSCHVCDQKFRVKCLLTAHMKKHEEGKSDGKNESVENDSKGLDTACHSTL